MTDMKLFYVETGSSCGIKKARTSVEARKKALAEVGSLNGVKLVRVSTEQDIAWVRGVGGYVPKITNIEVRK